MRMGRFAVSAAIRLVAFLIMAAISASMILPMSASAQSSGKTVKVGWHEAPYFVTDQFGRRSGYTYDYLQKIASYTGWNYEYVEGGWADLMEKLKNGEIDIMGNVSYTAERAADMLYASFPMGTESYYVFVAPSNTEITSDDYSTLNGKKVGVAKGSIQSGMFADWAKARGVSVQLCEMTGKEEDKWDHVNLAMGIAVFDPQVDASIRDTARRADQIMYEDKRNLKKSHAAGSEKTTTNKRTVINPGFHTRINFVIIFI